jgi:hypothetical protein
MFELIGLIFGGVSRLGQHWMELKDKQAERDHEARMFENQVKLQELQGAQRMQEKSMDLQETQDTNATNALIEAIKSQDTQATAAGGFFLKFSAFIRPFLTFWHCIVIYTAAKVATFLMAYTGGITWSAAFLATYTDFDRALCSSLITYWITDRSLSKWVGKS